MSPTISLSQQFEVGKMPHLGSSSTCSPFKPATIGIIRMLPSFHRYAMIRAGCSNSMKKSMLFPNPRQEDWLTHGGFGYLSPPVGECWEVCMWGRKNNGQPHPNFGWLNLHVDVQAQNFDSGRLNPSIFAGKTYSHILPRPPPLRRCHADYLQAK